MSWRDFFKSSHTLWLEKEVEFLKKTHAEELSRVMVQNDKLRDELQRTRILLSPGLQAVTLPHENDDETPPPVMEPLSGTPWQRLKAQMIREDDERWRKAQAKQATLAQGETDGVQREGRVDAPQRVEGKSS